MANVPTYLTTADLLINYNILKINALYNYLLIKQYHNAAQKNNTHFINMFQLKPRNII